MKRVVITGIGLVTPIGIGQQTFWENLLAGKHGFDDVSSFDTSAYKVRRGAEVTDFCFDRAAFESAAPAPGRATQFALTAGREALDDAGLGRGDFDPVRAGVVMGTTSGEPNLIEKFNDRFVAGEVDEMGSALMDRYPCHGIPNTLAAAFGMEGFAPMMIPTACAAGNYAVAHAFEKLASGAVDLVLAGGSDAFSRITYTGFARLMAISDDIVRPFDRDRKGMIPGEGAGMLVLEDLEHALARDARIYAELTGYGLSCDAHHMTGGHPSGRGAVRAMRDALRMSGNSIEAIDYISAHGTGTRSNDLNETISVKTVFGERAKEVPISSIKSMLGHTMGAASAIETGMCALAITKGMIPATANYREPDPECDLDVVPNRAREMDVAIAMNNAYAFGGTNASLVLERFSG